MNNNTHLVADISGHGFGHLAMTAPVLDTLAGRYPGLRLTVRTSLPREVLQRHITTPYQHIHAELDFGMVMSDSLKVDTPASTKRYREFHQNWEARVKSAAHDLACLKPDLLLANVPYLSLAAAKQAAIPAVALCCLNWAEIYRHYCAGENDAESIAGQIEQAYQGATTFLRVAPTMPMAWLDNARDIGPIATLGHVRRDELNARLRLKKTDHLVLVSLGGIPHALNVSAWPKRAGWHWVIPDGWPCARPDMTSLGKLEIPYKDILASCDALITKPGYGTFAEAACHGKPLLYVSRDSWPEQPYLIEWLARVGRCAAISQQELEQGRFHEQLEALLAYPAPPPVAPSGIGEAANYFATRL